MANSDFFLINLINNDNAQIVYRKKGDFKVATYYISAISDVCIYNSLANVKKSDGETGIMFQIHKNVAASVLSYITDANTIYLKIKCGAKSGYVTLGKLEISTGGMYSINTSQYGSELGYLAQSTVGKSNLPKSKGDKVNCKYLNNGSEINTDAIIYGSLQEENLDDSEGDGVSDDIVTAADASLYSNDGTTTMSDDEIDPTYEFQLTDVGTFYYNIADFLPGGENGANTSLDNYVNAVSSGSKKFDYGYNYRTLFGAPYQFLPTTDCRISRDPNRGGEFINYGEDSLRQAGYEFANKIISKMPILYITPGNTSFMGSSSKDAREKLLMNLCEATGVSDNSLSAMLDDYTGKLYTISPAYAEYFNYVNPMCRAGAIFLGIGDKRLHGIQLKNYHWGINQGQTYQLAKNSDEILGSDQTEQEQQTDEAIADTTEANEGEETPTEPEVDKYNYEREDAEYAKWESNREDAQYKLSDFLSALYYSNSIALYINSEYSFQETFTNETTESLLATTINSLSDRAREVQFLLGTASQAVGEAFDKVDGTLTAIKEQINSIVEKVAGGNSIFTTIANSVKTIVSGGRMQFPQIWANSTFSKSYQITMKLITPNPDPYSWWLDCYVPMCHLMSLVMPRSEYVNSYTTPFLIKAFYKGMFNIDMGIITEMSFTRGKEGSWTKDGLPTVIEVSFTIQDLYSSMGMTSIGKMFKGLTMQNVAEMDYIANLCGININEPDVFRMVKFWAAFNIERKIYDFIPNLKLNIGTAIKTNVVNALNDLWM